VRWASWHMTREGLTWKTKPGACEEDPPVTGRGPWSTTVTSVQPRRISSSASAAPTTPAPMTTMRDDGSTGPGRCAETRSVSVTGPLGATARGVEAVDAGAGVVVMVSPGWVGDEGLETALSGRPRSDVLRTMQPTRIVQ